MFTPDAALPKTLGVECRGRINMLRIPCGIRSYKYGRTSTIQHDGQQTHET